MSGAAAAGGEATRSSGGLDGPSCESRAACFGVSNGELRWTRSMALREGRCRLALPDRFRHNHDPPRF